MRKPAESAPPTGFRVLEREGLDQLLVELDKSGFDVIGPVVRDGAIQFGEISSSADFPEGWHDEQAPGSYRLEHGGDASLFSWAVGPSSLKGEAFPSTATIWRAVGEGAEISFSEESASDGRRTAVVGARPCELVALEVLDRVLASPEHPDPTYRRRRPRFVLVAECSTPSSSCFCSSMGTGPAAQGRFDIALTEIADPGAQRFLVRSGSPLGAELLDRVPTRSVDDDEIGRREELLTAAVSSMGRRLDTEGLAELLARNIEHPRWDDVARRCLACGNCTLVCPTCFCSTIEDTTDLFGSIERGRRWASCFEVGHSYLHGGSVRPSVRSRYRQWMTHKLSTWWDQFDTSGCVGCGRCITWCPVGIDITEEAAAIRLSDGARENPRGERSTHE